MMTNKQAREWVERLQNTPLETERYPGELQFLREQQQTLWRVKRDIQRAESDIRDREELARKARGDADRYLPIVWAYDDPKGFLKYVRDSNREMKNGDT